MSLASSERAHELLGLDGKRASALVQFARVVAAADVSTTVKLVHYYRDNVVNNQVCNTIAPPFLHAH